MSSVYKPSLLPCINPSKNAYERIERSHMTCVVTFSCHTSHEIWLVRRLELGIGLGFVIWKDNPLLSGTPTWPPWLLLSWSLGSGEWVQTLYISPGFIFGGLRYHVAYVEWRYNFPIFHLCRSRLWLGTIIHLCHLCNTIASRDHKFWSEKHNILQL
jgi:hypothetical protein